MLWIIFILLFITCFVSECIQAKNKTNNNVRSAFFVCVFIYHLLSIKGAYNDTIIIYSLSYWIGFFLSGIIMTIIEIWALFKSLDNNK